MRCLPPKPQPIVASPLESRDVSFIYVCPMNTRPSSARTPRRALLAIAVGVLALGSVSASARAADEDAAPGDSSKIYRTFREYRTYAREDTVQLPLFIYRDDIDIEASRVSLKEIIRRCIEAEKTKYDDVEDIQFTVNSRAVIYYGDAADSSTKRTVHEGVSRIYRKQPDRFRAVSLGQREYTVKDGKVDPEDDSDDRAGIRASTREELTDLPFFFEDLSDYNFDIRERVDLDDRVLYRIGFEPRSEFDPLPSGEFWLDTTDFQVVHVDMSWTENLPMPMILKDIDHVSIEKKKIHGVWVYDRISARVHLRKVPLLPLPRVMELVVRFQDYMVNQGLGDDVFDE